MKIKNVAFLGFADAKPEDQEYKDAVETAKLLAQNGEVIVDGGGPGVGHLAGDGFGTGKRQAIERSTD